MRKPICILAALALQLSLTSAMAQDYEGHDLAPKAKISIAKARLLATKARRGTIMKEELEAERGGTGLRYSFDVKAGKRTWEVGIDAETGKVLENKLECPNPD